ncbi:MAG TPA: hypothetical protein VFI42_14480, partial [Thermomicrobiaceae bacterium]|nr:hypothetical protein [Thermomicrobiaceae bacterium]
MAERSPREADDFGASADPALARLLRDLDALWGSPQPPAGLERAITRLARQPLPSRRFPPRRVMELAAAVVVVGLVAALVAALSIHDSPSAPATGSGQPALAAAPASPTPAATPTPITWAAPGTIQGIAGSPVAGQADALVLPNGQLAVDITVTAPSDELTGLTWNLIEG